MSRIKRRVNGFLVMLLFTGDIGLSWHYVTKHWERGTCLDGGCGL